jgi:hypothetical protein
VGFRNFKSEKYKYENGSGGDMAQVAPQGILKYSVKIRDCFGQNCQSCGKIITSDLFLKPGHKGQFTVNYRLRCLKTYYYYYYYYYHNYYY